MFRRLLHGVTFWILAATLLAACGVAASPTPLSTGAVPPFTSDPLTPTSTCPSSKESSERRD